MNTSKITLPSKNSTLRQIVKIIAVMVLIVISCIGIFLNFYGRYNDNILYSERLNQMQDVTTQLFSGLEDVVRNQWNTADVFCNYMELAQPQNEEDLLRFIGKQAALNNLDKNLDCLIAVDSRGRYYTQDGQKGTLQELDYLLNNPARISFVSNTVTTNRTKMVFLNRLETPVVLDDGTKLIYYGFTRDMTELEPYFDCAAYSGDSSVYVLDNDGLKLFSSKNTQSDNGAVIKGFNVYHVLENMKYLHGSSFASAKEELDFDGLAYSNAILDGEEYYYALYHMENAEWTLVFLVKSSAVALNTVKLVNTTVRMVLIFAVIMAATCAAFVIISLRKQQKKELKAAEVINEELEKVNEKLENAVETAETASHAKSDFLANMSHDIRTPMNAIVGIASLMANEEGLSDKMHTYIQKIQLSSRHLLSLINDILDMSKIESSEVSLNKEPVNLAEQVGQLDSIIRSQTNERGQTFRIYVHEIVHENLIADGVRLRQMVLNLLSNATKYTPAGGTVTLDLAELPCEKKDYAKFSITVTDTGYGMDPEFVEHIFEPFTRAENSTTNKIQGTGLGMAITKSIVDLMGGTITVDSTPGKGSRFEVVLSLQIDTDSYMEMDAETALLITDDKILIQNVQASLHNCGATFLTVPTTSEALALLADTPADVVMLGGHLHDASLQATVAQLRKVIPHAVFIFCVDYAQPEQEEKLLAKSGVDGLIPRPFFFSNLIKAMERADAPAPLEPSSSVLHGLHFLCAEDNSLNAEILEALLQMKGADCVIYPNGRELVDAFANVNPGDFDAILMDVQMPKMNGLEATRAIRNGKNPLGQTIPILAMTANAFSEDIQNSVAAGMDAHISKPIDISVLEREMSRFITPRVRDR